MIKITCTDPDINDLPEVQEYLKALEDGIGEEFQKYIMQLQVYGIAAMKDGKVVDIKDIYRKDKDV